jgi:hypothetical protein
MIFLKELEKSFQIKMKMQNIPITKAILSKISNVGGITIPDFKIKWTIFNNKIAMVWYWDKNSHINQQKKLEDLEINSFMHI